MRKRVISVRCPTCRRLVLQKQSDFPFCSERCRLIDLGKWASGGYVISTPITDPEQFEATQEKQSNGGSRDPDSNSGER
jgi:endogenous inhibitor of DNA gyrase (YacG/DUF329 family)